MQLADEEKILRVEKLLSRNSGNGLKKNHVNIQGLIGMGLLYKWLCQSI